MENQEEKDYVFAVQTLSKDSKKGFSLLVGINRGIIPSHVTKLAKSIEKMGLVRPVVIVEVEFINGILTKFILDGQHLYFACLRMNINIPYVTIKVKDFNDLVEHIALLNTSSKSWTMKDYILVWSGLYKDYKKLNTYHNTYDIELVQLAEILMTNNCVASARIGGGVHSGYVKNGLFTIKNEEYAVKLLNYVTDALKIIPRMDRGSNKLFIASYISFINSREKYDHKDFIKKLKEHKEDFNLATSDPLEFQKLLETL